MLRGAMHTLDVTIPPPVLLRADDQAVVPIVFGEMDR
jgi:hypothetical protein